MHMNDFQELTLTITHVIWPATPPRNWTPIHRTKQPAIFFQRQLPLFGFSQVMCDIVIDSAVEVGMM